MTHPTTSPRVLHGDDTPMPRVAGLEYEEHGDGDAVLFIHGAIVADAFASLIRRTALDGYRRIRYRRRGYGRSDRLSTAPSVEQHAADAQALLDALGVKRAHVIAHSGGGPIAVQIAAEASDVVPSLVLLEPALFTARTAATFLELTASLVDMYGAGQAAKAVHLWMRSVGGRHWRAEIEAHIPDAGSQAEADAAATFHGDVPAIGGWDFDAVRGRIAQPVLHVAGACCIATAEPAAALLRDAVAGLEEVVIDGSNHMNVVLNPSTASAIAGFLERYPLNNEKEQKP